MSGMAFDEELAERVRGVLASAGMTPAEKKMFGGLSFLISGNMCCGVMGADLLARVGPDAAGSALKAWVDRALAYATSLPPKKG